jgi:hypothetical protein
VKKDKVTGITYQIVHYDNDDFGLYKFKPKIDILEITQEQLEIYMTILLELTLAVADEKLPLVINMVSSTGNDLIKHFDYVKAMENAILQKGIELETTDDGRQVPSSRIMLVSRMYC